MVGVFTFILKIKGLNFTNDMYVVNSDKLTKYFLFNLSGRCLS
jgi:hypothetical protein